MTFRRKPKAEPVRLILVGLGNPGREYSGTRHNLGFMCLDEVARRLGVRVTQKEASALVAVAKHPAGSGSLLLVKPQTFMNLSGRSVAKLMRKHGLEASDVWVVYDELDLAFARIRIRKGGGAGGHNGVRSLIADLGGDGFVRFRLGVGRPGEDNTVDHLLSPFTDEERQRLPDFIALAADAVIEGLTDGIDITMNRNNGKSA